MLNLSWFNNLFILILANVYHILTTSLRMIFLITLQQYRGKTELINGTLSGGIVGAVLGIRGEHSICG